MAVSLLSRINIAIQRFEVLIRSVFGRKYPPAAVCFAIQGDCIPPQPTSLKFSIKEFMEDSFLWAVPKHRRSIEKRLKRKFGSPEYVLKILTPKTNLRICNTCGDNHEAGVFCPTCYKKVIEETRVMQDAIQNHLKLEPVEKEVVVLYEGEKDGKSTTFEGKQIVEIKKSRPIWFSKNLLQQTTQTPSTASDVKPSNLG